jgi:hypothetical protein
VRDSEFGFELMADTYCHISQRLKNRVGKVVSLNTCKSKAHNRTQKIGIIKITLIILFLSKEGAWIQFGWTSLKLCIKETWVSKGVWQI